MRRLVLGVSLGFALMLPLVLQARDDVGDDGGAIARSVSTQDVRTLDRFMGLGAQAGLRVSRAGFQLVADEGCTDALPYACNGANMCCDTPSIYYCENYQGPIKEMRGRSGCIKAGASDEAVKDFSQSCSRFTAC